MAIWLPTAGRTVAHSDHGAQPVLRKSSQDCLAGRRLKTFADYPSTRLPNSPRVRAGRKPCGITRTSLGARRVLLRDTPDRTSRKQLVLTMFDWIETRNIPSGRIPITNKPTRPPQRRHDQHNQPVHLNGEAHIGVGRSLGPRSCRPVQGITLALH